MVAVSNKNLKTREKSDSKANIESEHSGIVVEYFTYNTCRICMLSIQTVFKKVL